MRRSTLYQAACRTAFDGPRRLFLRGIENAHGYEGYDRLTRIERPQGPWALVQPNLATMT
jgi:hypothetical protein